MKNILLGLAVILQPFLIQPPANIDSLPIPPVSKPVEEHVVEEKLEPIAPIEPISDPEPKVVQSTPASHSDWLRAAGVSESDWSAAEVLVHKESSWNPLAVNKSSGACSLAQALPCSKIKGDWRDPVVALKWMNDYVMGRYGSWDAALAFHRSHNWY